MLCQLREPPWIGKDCAADAMSVAWTTLNWERLRCGCYVSSVNHPALGKIALRMLCQLHEPPCIPWWVGRDSFQHSSELQMSAARWSSGSSRCLRSSPLICGDDIQEPHPPHQATGPIQRRSRVVLRPASSEQNQGSLADQIHHMLPSIA